MKKILILKYSVLLALLMMFSCDQEDYTGYSTLVPTSPSVSVSGIPSSINFVEKDSTFTFNVTLSEAQVVDVVIVAKQIAGTATEGEDFKILNDGGKLTFAAGSTTGQIKIKVLADAVQEDTETATIQIGDATTANAAFTPVTVQMTIKNYLKDDLSVDMSWATDVATSIGMDLDPDEVVDLRLLIVKASDKTIVAVEDGATFETYADFNALPNGDYLIAADIYSTIDAGDYNKPVNIDIDLAFNETGAINNMSLSFPKVMTNEKPCSLYRTYLASVKKSGSSYTIAKAVSYMIPPVLTWKGEDATYPSEVTTTASCSGKSMTGLNFGWMLDWWGEVIVSGGTLIYTTSGSTITIPFQKYCKTTYNGAPQPEYSIQGSGTIDNSGAYPVWTIHYDLQQSGIWIGHYCYLNYGWEQDGFDAVITTNPAGKGKGASNFVMRPAKPNR
jgi:hypothetical protein